VQVLLGGLMPAVAPLALDKDKEVRAAAVAALHILVARAAKEAEVIAAAAALVLAIFGADVCVAGDEWGRRFACGGSGCIYQVGRAAKEEERGRQEAAAAAEAA
jgi:hypothetical protein